MYLRRLEIAGFKSFAGRVKFDFKPGVVAIVGPNGSGKSNVAEAIQWVLGAQNSRDLRARKSEELIYSGSEGGKTKASMAEVVMTLEGKTSETELGVDQLIVSRRLYRSGETEYRLGGRKVLVKDLMKILAQAGFGTSSYTVIGQGMIDSLIIASPAERKLLFEEASGIRAFELERADTLRKLARAEERATALRDEVSQLIPERDALALQVDRLARHAQLTAQLRALRSQYIGSQLLRLRTERAAAKQSQKDWQQKLRQSEKILKQRQAEAQALASSSADNSAKQAQLLERLSQIDSERTALAEQIATIQAQLQILDQLQRQQGTRPVELKDQLKQIDGRLVEFRKKLIKQVAASEQYADRIAAHNKNIEGFTKQLTRLRAKLRSNQRNSYLAQALGLARLLVKDLQSDKPLQPAAMRLALHKLIRSVKLASESDLTAVPLEIAKLQQQISREIARREDIVEQQTTEIIKVRSIELDIHALEREEIELQARLAETREAHQDSPQERSKHATELRGLTKRRDALDGQAATLRAELTELTAGGTTDEQVALAHAVDAAARVVEDAQAELARLENAFQDYKRAEQALRDQATAWHIAARPSDQVENVDERDITRVEAEIEVIGEVDEALVQAHTELADRVSYLETQATDMEAGVKDLRKVLTELERRIQTTFEKNFARINTEYTKQFARLFRGGSAALELTRYEDDEYGIEITAKPPGKRVELLSSLSGGERALAAIALLAAILSVNPSPFVVLDEVDAALDDANAQLFTETLKQLARHSQLLVITHNHETMLSADALYGITTTPKAASTVIAVDLQAAEALTVG